MPRSFGLLGSSSNLLVACLQSTLLLLLPILPVLQGQQQRPKEIDESYQRLIPFLEVPLSCDSTDNGYGIVDGQLEKCEIFLKEDKQMPDNAEDDNYEKYKCRHLRVNAKYNSVSKLCECEHNWKGPICNDDCKYKTPPKSAVSQVEIQCQPQPSSNTTITQYYWNNIYFTETQKYIGCPEGFSLHNGVCTPNKCQHEGQLALGSKHIECICKAPWDGRWCERLACWRMAPKEHERRWRNANNDHCKCADGFQGENCDKIVFCKNGELVGGRCQCAEGFKGEVCERKCIPNQTCSASSLWMPSSFTASVLALLVAFSLAQLLRRSV